MFQNSEFCVCEHYPGQKLKGYFSELAKVRWQNTTKTHNPTQAKKNSEKEVICTVVSVSFFVHVDVSVSYIGI